jgi:hypothetical protein
LQYTSKQIKHVEHTLETCVCSHCNICNIKIKRMKDTNKMRENIRLQKSSSMPRSEPEVAGAKLIMARASAVAAAGGWMRSRSGRRWFGQAVRSTGERGARREGQGYAG